MGVDRWLFEALYEIVPAWLSVPVTHLGTHGALWLLIAVVLLVRGPALDRRAAMAMVAAVGAIALLADFALKNLVARVRPWKVLDVELHDTFMNAHGYSFPSGHAAMSLACAWILGQRFPVWRAPLLVLAAAIAISRVVVGAHWPSDVAVGAVIGVAVGALASRTFGVLAR